VSGGGWKEARRRKETGRRLEGDWKEDARRPEGG
jgi:hypothetical protein